ncbi:MAG: PEP-CTERM sorting domain-containing protein [Terriglobales bacterium]
MSYLGMTRTSKTFTMIIAIAGGLLLLQPQQAHAGTITFSGINAGLNGGVDARAVVTTGAGGKLTIVLTNLISNEVSVGQALTAFTFTLGNGTASSITGSGTGTAIYVDSSTDAHYLNLDGSYSSTPVTYASNWGINGVGTDVSLSWFKGTKNLPITGSGHASGTLLGPGNNPPAAPGVYSSAKGSIAANPAHDDFFTGDMTFTLNVTGVTDATTVSDAVFYFNTSSGSSTPGIALVPEPASYLLFASGLLGLAWFARERRVA